MLAYAGPLALGLLLGMRHATDADHVVAVSTIVSESGSIRRAASVGALWGVGHSVTVLLLGGSIVLFRVAIPPRVGLALEFAVAVMLVLLGVFSVARRAPGRNIAVARPLVVGFVHGLAGSAFVAMLVLAVMPSAMAGMAYLLLFGAGTVAGMMAVTALIAVPASWGMRRFAGAQRGVQVAAGVASVAFGLMLAHDVGIGQGLFSQAPWWSPR